MSHLPTIGATRLPWCAPVGARGNRGSARAAYPAARFGAVAAGEALALSTEATATSPLIARPRDPVRRARFALLWGGGHGRVDPCGHGTVGRRLPTCASRGRVRSRPCPTRKTRRLTAADEQRLARRIERGELAAKEQFVLANLGLVRALAAGYCDRGVVYEDLVQQGTLTSSACRAPRGLPRHFAGSPARRAARHDPYTIASGA